MSKVDIPRSPGTKLLLFYIHICVGDRAICTVRDCRVSHAASPEGCDPRDAGLNKHDTLLRLFNYGSRGNLINLNGNSSVFAFCEVWKYIIPTSARFGYDMPNVILYFFLF